MGEFWDPRSKARIGILAGQEGEVTALDFSRSGESLALGTSNGLVQLFDLRKPVPLLRKDQGYGYPIKTLMHMTTSSQEKKILSADKRIIKLWDEADGKAWTSVEPAVDINSVAWCKDSGMLLTANEGQQQHAFFIPQLGPAPKWCAFLDNIATQATQHGPSCWYDKSVTALHAWFLCQSEAVRRGCAYQQSYYIGGAEGEEHQGEDRQRTREQNTWQEEGASKSQQEVGREDNRKGGEAP